jgi:hypothetical protein
LSAPSEKIDKVDNKLGIVLVNQITEETDQEAGLSLYAMNRFADRWKDRSKERQEAESFWQEFFRDVCGLSDLREAKIEFQKTVVSEKNNRDNYIDVFWEGVFLAEHKSAGKNLDEAEKQARHYNSSLPPALRPPVLLITDFAKMRIVEYLTGESIEFALEDLPKHKNRLERIVLHKTPGAALTQIEADQKAAKLMANLYVELEINGYEGHQTSVFLVRTLFCLFADDTQMWKKGIFLDFLNSTVEDGSGVGARIQSLFEILNTPKDKRPKLIDETLREFPYVNGGLFAEQLSTVYFTREMRGALLKAAAYDWSAINPTIFGSLFQSIKSKEARRLNGEHYTTEGAIDKVLNPIIMDSLNQRLVAAWDNNNKLRALQKDLGRYQILDPACGSGNFLITAYKRLRQLELEIIVRIKQLEGKSSQVGLLDATMDLTVSLNQLHGIEHEEWSSQIASVAIFLTDHQENLRLETVLGFAPDRFPLTRSANIFHGNALTTNWADVCEMNDDTLIIGNPPFSGYSNQSADQKKDQVAIWGKVKGAGLLDYVSNWFLLAARNLEGTLGKFAFVSTNSIVQGVQPATLWGEVFALGYEIEFAHQTFAWQSDVSGKAAVHTVIVGCAPGSRITKRWLYTYEKALGAPLKSKANFINGYLVDAPNILVRSRPRPMQPDVQIMDFGSKPTDEGYLSNISQGEADEIISSDPIAARYLRPLIGAAELINGQKRYCLWLLGAAPNDLKASPVIRRRVEAVRAMRLKSQKPATQRDADQSTLFQEIRQPITDYLAVPRVSSENRAYVPMALMPPEFIASDALLTISNADLRTFAIMQSRVFSVWNSAVSGRLESRFRISAEITYNNFPFPVSGTSGRNALLKSGGSIIAARDLYPDSSLAVLYDRNSMPPELFQAHRRNDVVVLKAYGLTEKVSDSIILKTLFEKYFELLDSEKLL